MNDEKTGGPAFPIPGAVSHFDGGTFRDDAFSGMSLRDYFAAKAMQSLRLDRDFLLRNDPDQVADRSYEIADSMLKARKV